jgi:hypothetical protein
VRPPDPNALDRLRRWAVLLDSAFRIPGTRVRFGLDAIIGLVPGLGDLSAPFFAAILLATGFRMRLPAVIQARMVLNAAIDMAVGLIPVLGDVGDVFWKANLRNLALLERHAHPGQPPRRGDYIFVFVGLGLVALVALLPFVLLLWLFTRFSLV